MVDGDTIKVLHRGRAERVRLQGIDCPEEGQAFSKRAKKTTAELVAGQEVAVDVRGRDDYGRSLAAVVLADGRSLNEELVRLGLAWWYRRYSTDERLAAAEAEARAVRRGLWRDPHPIPPWEFRHRHQD